MSNELIHHVSDASFDNDVLKAEGPVLSTTGLSGAVRAR